jgi:hypothetical protein
MMSTDRAYKEVIKRVFARELHTERLAIYWRRNDNAIHVIAPSKHYVHKIAGDNENMLEFVCGAGDRIVVALTDEERRRFKMRSDAARLMAAHSIRARSYNPMARATRSATFEFLFSDIGSTYR